MTRIVDVIFRDLNQAEERLLDRSLSDRARATYERQMAICNRELDYSDATMTTHTARLRSSSQEGRGVTNSGNEGGDGSSASGRIGTENELPPEGNDGDASA
mmetsp:Transcript_4544/g.9839  ORF Transcript_4544/g.9839 Transcript_4544/m.9839 type:complete len:102 (+) Transcript_4544:715-1020(+)